MGSDTHYASGKPIQVGDTVSVGDWIGVVVFVVGTQQFSAEYQAGGWEFLGKGFMVNYDRAGLVFSNEADEEVLIARKVL